MRRRTLIKALLMLTFMICGMKGIKTIAAENRWDNLITEISAERETIYPNFENTRALENKHLKNDVL